MKTWSAVILVTAGSVGIGYMLGGGFHPAAPTTDREPLQPMPLPTTPKKSSEKLLHESVPTHSNSDYTAPDAPKISIVEDSSSALASPAHPTHDQNKTPDAEASQEDAAPTSDGSDSGKIIGTSDTTTTTTPAPDQAATSGSDDAAPSDTNSPSSTATGGSISSGSGSDTAASGAGDQDYEKIGNKPDSEAGQDGTESPPHDSGPSYRVQIGAFGESKNARILADALQSRGYSASLRADKDGSRTVYRVETGTFRSKSAANSAVLDLKREGYPAFSSTIGPQ